MDARKSADFQRHLYVRSKALPGPRTPNAARSRRLRVSQPILISVPSGLEPRSPFGPWAIRRPPRRVENGLSRPVFLGPRERAWNPVLHKVRKSSGAIKHQRWWRFIWLFGLDGRSVVVDEPRFPRDYDSPNQRDPKSGFYRVGRRMGYPNTGRRRNREPRRERWRWPGCRGNLRRRSHPSVEPAASRLFCAPGCRE